ncbi:hypothetical protein ABW20_dc0105230 [Dactylellina cionopaga]|nr:hypothetical protein ABW20_dc0105230 [Dactylellina cionopaga]
MQAPVAGAPRPVSITRPPLKSKFSAGNIMRVASRRQSNKKRRSIPPPAQHVRRHIAKSGSDCSTCFGDDKNRDSVVVANRLASDPAPVASTSNPASSQSSPRSRHPQPFVLESRMEKTDSITVFSSPVIEEFSLQPKRKARPPSSAAATKTSSVYYESSAPPIPRRASLEDTGFNAQYKLLDEKIVRSVVYKAVAARKVEERKLEERSKSVRSSHRSEESARSLQSSQSNRTTYSERPPRTSSVTPKRSKSMGAGMAGSPHLSTARRSGASTPSANSRSGSANATVDSYYNAKHSSTGSRAGTVRSSGSTGKFVRQSTPFDNKPLPSLPDEASAQGSSDPGRQSPSNSYAVTMPRIATFEDLMSKTNSTITESAEINSVKQVTMVAGRPELL